MFVLAHCTVLDGGVQCRLFPASWYSVRLQSQSGYLISSAVENSIKLSLEGNGTRLARSSLPLTPEISDGETSTT